MAHFLDRTFFTALAVTLTFLAVLNITGSVPLAMVVSAAVPFPLRAGWRFLRSRCQNSRIHLRRSRKQHAAETVRCWSILRDADCRNDILALLRTAYPDAAARLCLPDSSKENPIPVHIMMTLRPIGEDAMADCLHRIREQGAKRNVIACTRDFSPEARSLAQANAPSSIALIDGAMLAALLCRHPDAVEFRSMETIRPRRIPLKRAHIRKLLPTAFLLLAMYFATGLPLYLPASMALFFAILMLLRKAPAPDSLFH